MDRNSNGEPSYEELPPDVEQEKCSGVSARYSRWAIQGRRRGLRWGSVRSIPSLTPRHRKEVFPKEVVAFVPDRRCFEGRSLVDHPCNALPPPPHPSFVDDRHTSFCPYQRQKHNEKNVHDREMSDAHDRLVLNDNWVTVQRFDGFRRLTPEEQALFQVRCRLELDFVVGFLDMDTLVFIQQ